MEHSSTAGEGIGRGAERLTEAAAAEIHNLIADVEDLIARLGDVGDADVTRLRSRIKHAAGKAKDALSSGADTLRRQARQTVATTDEYVHDNPWQAIGIAALVGAVVGMLASRRS